ncbi:MAG TPA: 23S rRNA (adenine(2503)-C(2))-methyltransferase RlmN [Polyangiales bacterium]
MQPSDFPPPTSLAEQFPPEWERLLSDWGEPRYRALQIFRWIYQRGVQNPAQMTDLPKRLRDKLTDGGLAAPAHVAQVQASADGTKKLLIELADGKQVETVLIPRGSVAEDDIFSPDGDADDAQGEYGDPAYAAGAQEITQCVSSQVGCAMGCAFCASGIAGLKRQMNASEIVSQVLLGRAALDASSRLAGVVFMGMGEPLHNYNALARTIRLLSHPEGMGMSLRRITVSTSGLVPEIDRLAKDFGGQVQLAVSVHAADTDTRTKLMPVNKKHPLSEVIAAIRRYPVPRRRRLTIEYTLVRGLNDSEQSARTLARILRGLRAKVNLIPMNPVEGTGLAAPDEPVVERFQEILRDEGLDTFLRRRRGDDIAAACGQLALRGEARKVRTLPLV